MVATEKGSGMTGKQMPNAFSHGPLTGKTVEQWGAELDFLKNKYSLLKRLIELSRMHGQGKKQEKQEDFLWECANFLGRALPDFENKYRERCERLECLKFLPEESSDELFEQMQRLQQDWKVLQSRMQELELSLLHTLVKRYPVIIV